MILSFSFNDDHLSRVNVAKLLKLLFKLPEVGGSFGLSIHKNQLSKAKSYISFIFVMHTTTVYDAKGMLTS